MIFKKLHLICFAVLAAGTLCACGAKSTAPRETAQNVATRYTASTADRDEAGEPSAGVKKIAKNADVSVIVPQTEAAVRAIDEWLSANGGYEFSRSSHIVGASLRVSAVYKVPPVRLQDFLGLIDEQGEMTSYTVSSEDITEQYYDAAARLESLKNGRNQYYEILKKAANVDEILKVQAQINQINSDLEALQGKISLWDKMTDESTVYLSITEESDPVRHVKLNWQVSSFTDIVKLMKNGLVITFTLLVSLLSWVLIIAVSALPVLITGAAVLILIRRIKKKKNQ